jgi:4-hydroxy-L-threonine phosphate dehydrogenase PdxA
MMLSTPKLKVTHITTHIGLIDAINRIEPLLVERTIGRARSVLVKREIQSRRSVSVDHGTASAIAGTGVADERSMLEAMRQAAELAQ